MSSTPDEARSEANPSVFDEGAPPPPARGPDPDVPDFDRYLPLRLLGVGGMGRVTAVRDQRLDREVALKEVDRVEPDGRVRPSAPGLEVRLAREAWITARLDHPGILPVHDIATREDGSVFYTMPVVRGRPLSERMMGADQRARQELLRRFLEACEAVAWAHAQGVVHRDLKPANIMIADGGGTRVVDWGLACLLDEPDELRRGKVGTPAYMSPEQRRGEPVDARADVWSLGVTLLELLAGRPLSGSSADTGPLVTTSRRAETAAMRRAHQLPENTPIELLAIATRATATAPDERYRDASELASDLARYLDGRRVEAHEYTPRELLVRFVRASKVPLLVAGVALLVVLVLVVVGVTRLAAEKDRAVDAEGRARAALARSDADLARSLASQARLFADRGARAEAEILAAHALAFAESPSARGVLARFGATPRPALGRRVPLPPCRGLAVDVARDLAVCRLDEAIELWSLCPLSRRWSTPARSTSAELVGHEVVYASETRELVWLDLADGRERHRMITKCGDRLRVAGDRVLNAHSHCLWSTTAARARVVRHAPCGQHYVSASAMSPDGLRWAAACSDGRVVLGEFGAAPGGHGGAELHLENQRELPTPYATPRIVMALTYLDARRLALGTNDGEVRTLDLDSGRLGRAFPSGFAQVDELLAAHPEGGPEDLVLARGAGGAPVVMDASTGTLRARMSEGPHPYLAWQGGALVEAGLRELRTWTFAHGTPSQIDLGLGITSVTFDPSATLLSVSHADGVEVRRLSDGAAVMRKVGLGVVKAATFTEGGGALHWAAASTLKSGRELSVELGVTLESNQELLAEPGRRPLDGRRVVALPNDWLVVVPYGQGLGVFPPGGAALRSLAELPLTFSDLALGGAGVVLLEATPQRIWWLPADAPELVPLFEEPSSIAVAMGRDPSLIATAGLGGVTLWDGLRGAMTGFLPATAQELGEVALDRDERWLAAGSRDGTVFVWDLRTRRLASRFAAHRDRVAALAFEPAGHLLVSGGWDGRLVVHLLDALDTPSDGLAARLEASWALTRDAVLSRAGDLGP